MERPGERNGDPLEGLPGVGGIGPSLSLSSLSIRSPRTGAALGLFTNPLALPPRPPRKSSRALVLLCTLVGSTLLGA